MFFYLHMPQNGKPFFFFFVGVVGWFLFSLKIGAENCSGPITNIFLSSP